MRWRALLGAALVVLLTFPTTGFGWFRSLFARPAPAPVYYCPAPIFMVAPAVMPAAPTAPVRMYAEPRPAPPSGSSVEPPRAPELMPKAGVNPHESQKVSEKFYDSYFVAGGARSAADRCAVTFWNLSGQGITLTVDGQARTVAAGRSVRLDLKRDFTWGVAGREAERQQVPAQESGMEIVIRR